jgi:hypothetical protein
MTEPGRRVFLCYRHRDAGFASGRIAAALADVLGERNVFRYVDRAGVAFDDIQRTLLDCHVVLALIGDRWLETSPEPRGLDDPNDFLRLEIEVAFARNLPVIPVLIEGARLPYADELPDSLRPLARINPVGVTDRHFHADMHRLVDVLQRAQPEPPRPPTAGEKVTAEDLFLVWWCWRSPQHDHLGTGLPVYRFDVVIGAEPAVLDRIEKVIYFLPPAWGPDSPAVVQDRPSAFRLRRITWWELTVRARVYVRDQPDVIALSAHVWRQLGPPQT